MTDHNENALQRQNETLAVDEKSTVIKYFQSLCKQIACINSQLVNNTSELKLLQIEMKKLKNCSCDSNNNEDISESTNDDKQEAEFNFPIQEEEIFIKFNDKIDTDSKFNESLKCQMMQHVNKNETLVKNMSRLIRAYISRDIALNYVPSNVSHVDKNKKVFKTLNFYTSIEDILLKKLGSNTAYAVDKPAILNGLKSVLRGARDWDGHGLLRKINSMKKKNNSVVE
ncbi:uncharacterized protein LOC141525436 [Cotesia typhae]|uniref:uncharacterized protein LOC141525436 n=1 Tax=Cotesia typhae TaxID=2053667 RepID=UPI003D6892C6